MKVLIRKEVEETIDVEFPVYKSYAGLKKILSPSRFIGVSNDTLEAADNAYSRIGKYLTEGDDIEASVFNNALQDALSKFNQMAFMEATTPATDTDIREKLYDEREDRKHFEDNYDSSIHPLN